MEHHFSVEIAKCYGIEGAIILHFFYYWIVKNAVNGLHFYDGHYWTSNTLSSYSEFFPYMSEGRIFRVLKRLEVDGLLLKGNHGVDKRNRTNWYAFTDKGVELLLSGGYDVSSLQNCKMHFSKIENAFFKNEKCTSKLEETNIFNNTINDSNINGSVIERENKDSKDNRVDEEIEKKEEKEITKEKDKEKMFSIWWDMYGLKVNKAKCHAKWLRLKVEEMRKCLEHTPAYVASTPDRKYRKHPLTYLNGACWDDEIIGPSGMDVGVILGGDRQKLIDESKKELWK